MKNRLHTVLILAAALSASASVPLSAASNGTPPLSYPVGTLTATARGGEQIQRGSPRAFVSWAMRTKAHQELSPNVWAFSGYCANADLPNQQGCETLVITFAHDEVVDMQLVNKPAVAAIAASLRLGSSVKNIASR